MNFCFDFKDFGYLPSTSIAEPEIIKQNETDRTKRLSKSKPELFRKVEVDYSKHYLEKIVELARQNNCEVVFLYLPESGSNLKVPLLKDYYQSFGELIVLPDSILTVTPNWKDATHFNDSGAVKVSVFVVSEISVVK